MVRRVSIPGADELFRRTGDDGSQQAEADEDPTDDAGSAAADTARSASTSPVPAQSRRARRPSGPRAPAERTPSGRVRHDEKMTVYVTAEELTEIELARLQLRSQHGLVVDRGRLVREAIAMALLDLEINADESQLVRRLGQP